MAMIRNAVTSRAAPPPARAGRLQSFPGEGARLSVAHVKADDPVPTPIKTTQLSAKTSDSMPGLNALEQLGFRFLKATKDRFNVWTAMHVPVTPQVWAIVLEQPGTAPTQEEVSKLRALWEQSAAVDREDAANTATAVGMRLAEMEEAARSAVRAGGMATRVPGRAELLESMRATRTAIRGLRSEISAATLAILKPIVERVSASAGDSALALLESEQQESALWGYPHKPSPQVLALLYVALVQSRMPVSDAAYGIEVRPDRCLFGKELWPASAEETAAAKAAVEVKLREQKERADLAQRQVRLDGQRDELLAVARAEILQQVNQATDNAREQWEASKRIGT